MYFRCFSVYDMCWNKACNRNVLCLSYRVKLAVASTILALGRIPVFLIRGLCFALMVIRGLRIFKGAFIKHFRGGSPNLLHSSRGGADFFTIFRGGVTDISSNFLYGRIIFLHAYGQVIISFLLFYASK